MMFAILGCISEKGFGLVLFISTFIDKILKSRYEINAYLLEYYLILTIFINILPLI